MPNSFDDDDINVARGPGDFGISELSRIGEQYNKVPFEQRRLRLRHQEARENINVVARRGGRDFLIDENEKLIELTKYTDDKDLLRRIENQIHNNKRLLAGEERSRRALSSIVPRLKSYNYALTERLNAQAVNIVGREMADARVSSYTSSLLGQQDVQVTGLGLAQQNSFADLTQQRETILAQIGAIRSDSVKAAESLVGGHGINPKVEDNLRRNAARIKELSHQLAPINAAIKTQKSLGLDPESKALSAARLGEKAENLLKLEGLRSDIAAGKGEYGNLSAQDIKRREIEAANNLVKALDDLRNAAGKSTEEIDELSKKVDEATEKFQEVQDAAKAGAGGGGSRLQGLAALASGAAQLGMLAGRGFTLMGVEQPMMGMANIAGHAAIENRKHDSWRAALAGNMTERLNLTGWELAHAFGENRAFWARKATEANIAGGVAATAAGTADVVEVGKNVLGAQSFGSVLGDSETVHRGMRALHGLGEGLILGASAAMDRLGELSSGQAGIAGTNLTMDAVRQIFHVLGYQRQQYRDHTMGLFQASMNIAGDRGVGFFSNVAGADFMDAMKSVGLASDQAASLALFGTQNIGSLFHESQLVQAQRFQNLGLGSAEENMHRMAMLAASSTESPSHTLEKILENAVAMGLDSSKAISALVESSSAIAEESALRGFTDTGSFIADHLLATMGASPVNQELAEKQARNAFMLGEQARNNTSVSWHGMLSISNLMDNLDLDFESSLRLQQIGINDLRSLEGMSEDEIQAFLFRRGVNTYQSGVFANGVHSALNTAISSKVTMQTSFGSGLAMNTGDAWANIIQPWLQSDPTNNVGALLGDPRFLPPDVHEALWRLNVVHSDAGADPTARLRELLAAAGFAVPDIGTLDSGEVLASGAGGDVRQLGVREHTRSARQNLAAGQSVMSDRSGTTGITELTMEGDITQDRVGPNAEATWADAAAKSAQSFGDSALKLNSASSGLESASRSLTRASGVLLEAARVYKLAKMDVSVDIPEVEAIMSKFSD